ncbi:ankyrin repeat domain-containing protein, partial [Rickettsia conorii]
IQKQDNNVNNETSELVTKFVKDETQMLLLPDDDIVLGKLTEQATLEQMDMYAYIELFQKKEEWIASAERRKVVESFIKYDNDINKKKDIYANLSYCSAVENAFRAVDRNNLFGLRALLDVYPILQEKGRSGETLLIAAIYNDNYYLAKFLVIRSIKISTLNDECQYPLDIALAQGNANIACMLIKAKGYN